jgi:hypothetical protein
MRKKRIAKWLSSKNTTKEPKKQQRLCWNPRLRYEKSSFSIFFLLF